MGCFAERTKDASIVGKLLTLVFLGLWFLEFVALILAHGGIGEMVPVIAGLPEALLDGFNGGLGIGELKSGMQIVQTESEAVLTRCSLDFATVCPKIVAGEANADPTKGPTSNPPDLNGPKTTADDEKAKVTQAFADGLAKAQKVVNDKYFGKPEMAEAASGLNIIKKELDENAPDGEQYCQVQNAVYCAMREAAIQTLAGADDVTNSVDQMANGPMMDDFNTYVGLLVYLHAFPYAFFVLPLLLFTGFWASASAGACFASKCGVVMYIFHFILTLVGTALGGVIWGILQLLGPRSNQVTAEMFVGELMFGFFAEEPESLQVVWDHIKTEFPDLWNPVFQPFADAGGKLIGAFFFFVVVGVLTIIYGLLVCIIRPYKKAAAVEEEAAK
jgi:hypothetical protein